MESEIKREMKEVVEQSLRETENSNYSIADEEQEQIKKELEDNLLKKIKKELEDDLLNRLK